MFEQPIELFCLRQVMYRGVEIGLSVEVSLAKLTMA